MFSLSKKNKSVSAHFNSSEAYHQHVRNIIKNKKNKSIDNRSVLNCRIESNNSNKKKAPFVKCHLGVLLRDYPGFITVIFSTYVIMRK